VLVAELPKCLKQQMDRRAIRKAAVQDGNPRSLPHLRRCERCGEKTGNELAPFHSITSSARTMIDGGMVMPSALAVLALITNSNCVGCSTGMSAGFVPRRILST